MNSVLKFKIDTPVEIALAFSQGKITPSGYGADQVMFTLEYPPDHITFLDLHAASQIEALGPARGERFVVCKRKGADRNNPVRWEFQLSNGAEKARAAREAGIGLTPAGRPAWGQNPPPARSRDIPNVALPGWDDEADAPRAEAAVLHAAAPVTPATEPARHAHQSDVTAGSAPRPGVSASKTKLVDALKTAVAAAHAATEYAKSIGYAAMPRFTGEDLRNMANTLVDSGKR